MFPERSRTVGPGTLAPNRSEIPSSGWMRSASTFEAIDPQGQVAYLSGGRRYLGSLALAPVDVSASQGDAFFVSNGWHLRLGRSLFLVNRTVTTDTDQDGLPDAWEAQFGLDPGVANATSDADGDGLTDANLADEYEFHLREGRVGTVLGINPPSRFGELKLDGSRVQEFAEKPDFHDQWINGGYFFFQREFLSYLDDDESCVLERQPLVRLAQRGQLSMYQHRGFWACMDTQRDKEHLEQLWASGKCPWVPATRA